MNWQIIVGIVFLIGGVGNIFEDISAFIFGSIVGLIFLYLGVKKKGTARTKKKISSPESKESRTLQDESYKVVGVSYYDGNIKKLAYINPDWNLSSAKLISEGKIGKKVFHHSYVNQPVKLVCEPQNVHDKNAVAVYFADELVGYISRDDNLHIRDILKNRKIIAISGFIGGGEYKIISENKEVFKSSTPHSITVRIQYM